ncbi:MAG TPA: amino acid adenylation domain-containing protein [Thermoanaerobaculia bacterium]|nr:amino acid adenylation domain-containing protein [Thermoanaerobaculia bacterium]
MLRRWLSKRSGAAPGPAAVTPEAAATLRRQLAAIWQEVLGGGELAGDGDFFRLGGHSLLATQIVARIAERCGVELPLRAVFEHPRVELLAAEVERRRRSGSGAAAPPIRAVPRLGEAFPLSFAQQRLWLLSELHPGDATYNIAQAVELRGPLDAVALRRAVDGVVRRHEALRTTFASEDGEPVQVVGAPRAIALPVVDYTAPAAAGHGGASRLALAEARRAAVVEASRPFDLGRFPLLRLTLLRLSADHHLLVLAMHHIASDGWSMGVFLRELAELYAAAAAGRPARLPELAIQYVDFALWQRQWLSGEVLERQLAYWRERLAGAPAELELPLDHPRPAAQSLRGAREELRLPAGLAEQAGSLARREGATPFMVLLGAFAALLARYGAGDDLVLGTPVANRHRSESEGLIGLFVNTLPLRIDLGGGPTFCALLGRVRETVLAAEAHQDVPFEKLVEELAPRRDGGRNPLFQVMFSLQNVPMPELKLGGLDLRLVDLEVAGAKFDLSLDLDSTRPHLAGWLEYATDLFDRPTALRMLDHFARLLGSAAGDAGDAGDAERPLDELPLLSAVETHQLLCAWQLAAAFEPRGAAAACLEQAIAAQAERSPASTAVVCAGRTLTYRELNRRANQLARHLRAGGIAAEAVVAIYMDRSPELIVALLAVLKAGAAYLPLDPATPRERLAFLCDDAAVALVLTQEQRLGSLPTRSAAALCLDRDWPRVERWSGENLPALATAQNLAYVIYTSGSQGAPKGVAVERGALLNYVAAAAEDLALRGGDRVLQFASVSFDTSAEEIYPTLLGGAALVLRDDEMIGSGARFLRACGELGITVLDLPTAYFHELAAVLAEAALPPALRLVVVGGERLQPEPLAAWWRAAGRAVALVNTYGPTEGTIVATRHVLDAGAAPATAAAASIGRPVANVGALVLGRDLRPLPRGAHGELYLAGAGLARGYLRRPDLTAASFLPNPLAAAPGQRLYRTGDRARHRADGSLEFLGRADDQVKIRGFRVEPGEIESLLVRHPQVRAAAVLAAELHGDRTLIACLVSAGGPSPAAAALRGYLRERLPDYMVPAAFVAVPELPLTPHGKVDRKALSRLAALDPAAGRGAAAPAGALPRTPLEELLAGIWSEVLGRERVGREQDFFELGGHSLLATQLISRVRGACGVELPLRSVFAAPTLAAQALQLGALLGGAMPPPPPPLLPASRAMALPLSFAQERLWFLDQLEPGSAVYNLPAGALLTGALDVSSLARALAEVLGRHEALRTTFGEAGGRPFQRIGPPCLDWQLVDLSRCGDAGAWAEARRAGAAEARRPFDLARGPLLRVRLLRLAGTAHVLLVNLHHIIADGWSAEVFLRELAALYQAFHAGEPSPLSALTIQYADFAVWQRAWLQGEALSALLAYWRQQLAGAPPVLDLPGDRPRPALLSFHGAVRWLRLAPGEAAAVRALGRRLGATTFMVLLAAFKTLLWRYTGRRELVVGTPIANRNRLETEELIGLFVNTLALRSEVAGGLAWRDLLAGVRETTLAAHAHQDLPFEKLVEELAPQRSLSHTPIFQVVFGLHNAPAPRFDLPGLSLRPLELDAGVAKFDLTFALEEERDLGGPIEYNTDLFDAVTIERLAGHFRILLAGCAATPGGRLADLPLLTAGERQQVAGEWNDTAAAFAEEGCLHELFAAQVRRTPRAVAVVGGGERLSYQELNARANRLAHFLRRARVGPEVRVGLCAERSPAMLVAMLAVLKAGGAYVPLDPADPAERRAFMLRDARVSVLLGEERWTAGLAPPGARTVILDDDAARFAAESEDDPVSGVTGGNLAYVIYTSGSTGRPKGAMNTHDGVRNGLLWVVRAYPLGPDDCLAQKTPYTFDVSVWEIFHALFTGARLVLPHPGGHLDSAYLARLLAEEGVTLAHFVPSMLQAFVATPGLGRGGGLRHLLSSGEALSWELQERCLARLDAVLYNLCGATECSVGSTCWTCERGGARRGVPIGRPIANHRLYVLDGELRPVPAGVPGELYIGGAGVGRGYFDRPALTAERFVPDPLAGEPGARLYRMGDLVRHRPGGELEFLGRVDFQVKVRGLRIELGEIEAALSEHPALREAVVVAREHLPGDCRLIAYMAGQPAAPVPAVEELRDFLRRRLPEYMVPAAFVAMAALPLTPSGKVDRGRLPEPSGLRPDLASAFVAARTPVERTLAEIWRELLRVDRVGIHDNFFALGGHSLLAAQAVARMRAAFGIAELPLRSLFREPTLEGLAVAVTQAQVDQGDDQEMAGLLAEVESLSAAELARLLEK